MKQWLQLALAGLLLAAGAFAQPSISKGGVVNAVSGIKPGLPNYGVAQGAFFSIYGRNLGPATGVQAPSYPLPKTLGGTSVKVTVGGTSVDAIVYYTRTDQVNAILPSTTPVGTGTVTVTYNGQTSATEAITVLRSGVGIVTLNGSGSGPGVVQNVNTATETPVNTITTSAKPGQLVILWATGVGPITGDDAVQPTAANLNTTTNPIEVFVGGKPATVSYAGRSGCCAGEDQIFFVVPSGVEGCYVPVVVKTGNIVSNTTTMSIAGDGGTCSDPNGLSSSELSGAAQSGSLRLGALELSKISTTLTVPILGTLTTSSETGSGTFSKYDYTSFATSAAQLGLQTVGSCVVFSSDSSTPSLPGGSVATTILDAGTLTLTSSTGLSKTFTKDASGIYTLALSTTGGGTTGSSTPVLVPGTYTVTATGGSGSNAVGAFTTRLTIPQALNWTNQAATTTVSRTAGQLVSWSGGDSTGYVVIYGFSSNNTASAGFYCTEKASVGSFTIPSYVLLALPQSTVTSGVSTGFLGVGNSGNPVRFAASGLDIGEFGYLDVTLKNVTFQ